MKWFSTVQRSPSFEKAVRQVTDEAQSALGAPPDLILLFVSQSYRADIVDSWRQLSREIPARLILGCTAGGVIGGGHEVEQEAAVSLTAALLPSVDLNAFSILGEALPNPDAPPKAWRDALKTAADAKPAFLVLSDPFSIDTDALITGLDYAFPGAVKLGGLASGGTQPNENLLLLGEKIQSRGAVGVSLTGDIEVETVVAQGCRPIGRTLSVTECDGNVLVSVDSKSPLAYLQELYEGLAERDRDLLQTSLFLGIVMDPFKKDPRQGDFLIRNIIGLDQTNGMMAIGAALRTGQTVQFHLRDATTSRDDLQMMLRQAPFSQSGGETKPAAAMLFSCVGRGHRLYGEADHDSSVLKSIAGDIPVGGFFCNGEIGPVGGKTYLHGYTSAIGFFNSKRK